MRTATNVSFLVVVPSSSSSDDDDDRSLLLRSCINLEIEKKYEYIYI